MVQLMKWLLGILILLHFNGAYAAESPSPVWFSKTANGQLQLHVELFMSSTCEHCHQADIFFQQLSQKKPWIAVHRYVINEDKRALETFYQALKHMNSNNFAVPTIMFCNSRWLGFDQQNTTGKGLWHALDFCYQHIKQEGQLTPAVENTLKQWSATHRTDMQVDLNSPGHSILRTVVFSALLEAYSPCSLFAFLLFLAFIWLYPHHRKTQFFSGLVFIVTLAILHSLEYVLTLAYQQMKIYAHWWACSAAFLLLILLIREFQSRRHRERSTSVWWAYVVLPITVIAVYLNQENCALRVGAVFQQWIGAQSLLPAAMLSWQGIYLLFYLASLVLLLCFFLIFGLRPAKLFSYAACVILACIAVLLALYPGGLANISLSVIVLILSLGVGWWLLRHENKVL